MAGAPGNLACPLGRYAACGCRCCGTPPPTCVYPQLGDDLVAIAADDQAVASNPNCLAVSSCRTGHDYYCCVGPEPVPEPEAQYEAGLYIGGNDRIWIRKSTDHCVRIDAHSPAAAVHDVPLKLPERFTVQSLSRTCERGSITDQAIGALGELSLRVEGSACVMDVHATLFFLDGSGVTAERLDADGVPFNGGSLSLCQ